MTTTTATTEGDKLRARAQECRQRSADSWDRSDTDGFMSQWASDATARKYDTEAEVADAGGMWDFAALFDAETGALVPAKTIQTRYGSCWALLDPTNPQASFLGFFNESSARKATTRAKNNRAKGYTIGTIRAAAQVRLVGTTCLTAAVVRADDHDFTNVEVIETESLGSDW